MAKFDFSRLGKVTIGRLKKDAPSWQWRAEQVGFGSWWYHGTRSGVLTHPESVRVYACSALSGPGDDDFVTQWYADDGQVCRAYADWLLELEKPF